MRITALITSILLSSTAPVFAAEPSWPDLRDALYGERELIEAQNSILIDAPYRTPDDARTQVAARIQPPGGRMLDSVTLILDENPMPVSAVFKFDQPLPRFFFDVTMRINGPTPLHVIAETTDGQLYVAEGYVKTSGQGACSAPPGTDPKLALESLGEMLIGIQEGARTASLSDQLGTLAARDKQLDLDISHPSHSGMQMDQISLLFIPMRYVENVEVDLNGEGYVDVTGSISLSENPQISLSVPNETRSVDVTMTDTDGTVTHASRALSGF
ncbi:quinoprotein dehydrogenase-associated SoxYZ-like carrier [Actibacterium lipolyticum]|uniref:Sulfur oxidation protein SoxZ n=1 Tax=Actibacterium lipolyticum TaxID=1524263 RepID=A0A238JRP0_9RHOB|nr:quinoprotein dehydrogenase-associated SoxYZ-like carrier [Actibacterium lipolyticum]SMX32406.1 sulfur oxidation protein SoxZ [Actibacterium lipolyticum]